jgi:hypothetical protein
MPGRKLIGVVERDGKRLLKCNNWRRSAKGRKVRKRRPEEAKAQAGL